MRHHPQTESLLQRPWFLAAWARVFTIVVSTAAEALVRDGVPVFVGKGAWEPGVCQHGVGSTAAEAQGIALAVQPIRAVEERTAQADAVPSQSRRRHRQPIGASPARNERSWHQRHRSWHSVVLNAF
jgi:hypothetical protein